MYLLKLTGISGRGQCLESGISVIELASSFITDVEVVGFCYWINWQFDVVLLAPSIVNWLITSIRVAIVL